jgi:hypothetical protein
MLIVLPPLGRLTHNLWSLLYFRRWQLQLLSSLQSYPQPQCLQSFKGPTSSFERLQQRAKLSLTPKPLEQADKLQLLAWCLRSLEGVITFLEGLKNFRRYSDRDWIVIVLLSISVPKTFQKVSEAPFALRIGANSPVESELNVNIQPFVLILIAR